MYNNAYKLKHFVTNKQSIKILIKPMLNFPLKFALSLRFFYLLNYEISFGFICQVDPFNLVVSVLAIK